MNDQLVDDMLSLMSDVVMTVDTHGLLDEHQLEQLHSLIEAYFQEKEYGDKYAH